MSSFRSFLHACHIAKSGKKTSISSFDVYPTWGLRKVRFADDRRGKGKRGGLRVIYYWWLEKSHFLLFVIYDKDKKDDLSRNEREMLRRMLEILKQGGTL